MTNFKQLQTEHFLPILKDLAGTVDSINIFIENNLWEEFETLCKDPEIKNKILKDKQITDRIFEVDKNRKLNTRYSIWEWLLFSSGQNKNFFDFYKKILQSPVFEKEFPYIYTVFRKNIDFNAKKSGAHFFPVLDLVQDKIFQLLNINNAQEASQYFTSCFNKEYSFLKQILNIFYNEFLNDFSINFFTNNSMTSLTELHNNFLLYSSPQDFESYKNKLFSNSVSIELVKELQHRVYEQYLTKSINDYQDYRVKCSPDFYINQYRFTTNWLSMQKDFNLSLLLPTKIYENPISTQHEKAWHQYSKESQIIAFKKLVQQNIKNESIHFFWLQDISYKKEEIQKLVIGINHNEQEKIVNNLANHLWLLPLCIGTASPLILEAVEQGLKKDPEFFKRLYQEHKINIFQFLQYFSWQVETNIKAKTVIKNLMHQLSLSQGELLFEPFSASNDWRVDNVYTSFGVLYAFLPDNYKENQEANPNLDHFIKTWILNKDFIETKLTLADNQVNNTYLLNDILKLLTSPKSVIDLGSSVFKVEAEKILSCIMQETPKFFEISLPYIKKDIEKIFGNDCFEKFLLFSQQNLTLHYKKPTL